uniref:Core shell protein Gag P30 domain-containing protein n=1 Tax=Aquila chrysaetos chrysaetos TaxID=223781 RepID=A0A663F7C0_AQUCH
MIIGSQRAPPRTAPRNSDEREPMNSPVAGRTRAKQKEVIQAPLRQALGTEGVATIKVPFSIVDLNNWKIAAGSYRENPDQAAHAFETMIQTQDPDWKDIQVIMDVLFDSAERDMIRRAAKTQVEAQVDSGVLQGTVEQNFPSTDPKWDPNSLAQRRLLDQYKKWVLFGIRNAMPKAINMSKLYEIKQDRKEKAMGHSSVFVCAKFS